MSCNLLQAYNEGLWSFSQFNFRSNACCIGPGSDTADCTSRLEGRAKNGGLHEVDGFGCWVVEDCKLSHWECRVVLSHTFCRFVPLFLHSSWRRCACFRRCKRRRRPRQGAATFQPARKRCTV